MVMICPCIVALGICQKCRLKVQWRFRYDKYKPLKNRGSCNDCKQKTVLKAYRSLCDPCSKARKVCASCCEVITADNENMSIDEDGNVSSKRKLDGSTESSTEQRKKSSAPADEEVAVDGMMVEEEESVADSTSASVAVASVSDWDCKKFSSFAASKYDKNRLVGSEANTAFTFGEPAAAPAETAPAPMEP